jgi:hypothetical protein
MKFNIHSALINCVKYFPVFMQFVIFLNLFEYYYGFKFTSYVYIFLGSSVLWCLLLLLLSFVFKFCIWHRLLIYNIIFNLFIEFFVVNIAKGSSVENAMAFSSMITTLFIISSIVTRFKFGCRK